MLFRLILLVIIIGLVVFFVVFNVEPRVVVHLIPGYTLQNIPLGVVIIVSFLLGLILGALISFPQIIKTRFQIRTLRKEKERLEKELKELKEKYADYEKTLKEIAEKGESEASL